MQQRLPGTASHHFEDVGFLTPFWLLVLTGVYGAGKNDLSFDWLENKDLSTL
jgi:hypothetical protein